MRWRTSLQESVRLLEQEVAVLRKQVEALRQELAAGASALAAGAGALRRRAAAFDPADYRERHAVECGSTASRGTATSLHDTTAWCWFVNVRTGQGNAVTTGSGTGGVGICERELRPAAAAGPRSRHGEKLLGSVSISGAPVRRLDGGAAREGESGQAAAL